MWHTTVTNRDGTFSPAICIADNNRVLWVHDTSYRSEDEAAKVGCDHIVEIKLAIDRMLTGWEYRRDYDEQR